MVYRYIASEREGEFERKKANWKLMWSDWEIKIN